MTLKDLKLHSKDRWRATAAEKRLHGGSTVTEFWVTYQGKQLPWQVTGYGASPATRKAFAKQAAVTRIESEGAKS